ncbi:serine/threonine kinase [Fimbriiglobus ruber]|uniref:Serine/threonine kinase n=1 Tax=Fimbriiglobus ruber TaxID=1908690 RepID=A0A225DIG9_9BACT|nr:serine/threonine kinase [Fimbriiglobus ruber]
MKDNPQHRVTISKGFWMGIFPVTQAQWQAVMGYNPSKFRGDDRPVEMVSRLDCQEFCQKMAKLTDKPIRLPTEAEWEYACRAGTTSEYWSGNGADALKKAGWFDGNSGKETKPIGKLAPNPWGLYDIHGNVWEWCSDWYGLLTIENQIDPEKRSNVHTVLLRGGGWDSDPDYCLAACRFRSSPDSRVFSFGFRVCFRLD